MLLDPLDPTHSAILEILAETPGKTVKEIHQELSCRNIDISQPNLYRIIGQFIDARLLVKSKQALSINLVWAHTLLSFADTVRENYLSKPEAAFELPKEGKRKTIKADSLFNLDRKWDHLILEMVNANKGIYNEWYEYQSHPWHMLGMPGSDADLYALLESHDVECHLLHGNDTFLDLHGIKLIDATADIKNNLASTQAPFPRQGYLVIVYGPYIMECIFPPILVEHFSVYFDNVDCLEDFDAETFASIFRMKADCNFTVRRDEEEAEMLKKKMVPFFREK